MRFNAEGIPHNGDVYGLREITPTQMEETDSNLLAHNFLVIDKLLWLCVYPCNNHMYSLAVLCMGIYSNNGSLNEWTVI